MSIQLIVQRFGKLANMIFIIWNILVEGGGSYLRYFVLDLVGAHVLVFQGVVQVPEHRLLAHGAVQGLG